MDKIISCILESLNCFTVYPPEQPYFDERSGTKMEQNEGGKMARILTRKGKKKTTYTITVRVKGYESISRTFDTKGEARHVLSGLVQQLPTPFTAREKNTQPSVCRDAADGQTGRVSTLKREKTVQTIGATSVLLFENLSLRRACFPKRAGGHASCPAERPGLAAQRTNPSSRCGSIRCIRR